MRLEKKQKEVLLKWVAEGLESDEINKRAQKFKPPFKISRNTVRHYRQSRNVKLEEIKEASESDALKSGLAIKEARVAALKELADVLLNELTRETDNRLWTENAKGIGNERYDYEEFNKAEIDAFRGLLDDIASELGERQPGVQVNNNFNFSIEEWKKAREQRLKEVEALEEVD